MWRVLVPVMIASFGCRKKAPEAPPEFSDAIVTLFTSFDDPEEDVALAMIEVEAQVYAVQTVEASEQ